MGRVKETLLENNPMIGEIFEDGQFRGHRAVDVAPPPASIEIGDYALWDGDDDTFYILFIPTGEIGAFRKEEFEAHVKAFFGLHF
jgi:hypothetical protein